MKKGIHPEDYRYVVFEDNSVDFRFLSRSCVRTSETTTWTDGKEYPVFKLDISSASHPFFTGKQKLLDREGRVDKFMKRLEKVQKEPKKK